MICYHLSPINKSNYKIWRTYSRLDPILTVTSQSDRRGLTRDRILTQPTIFTADYPGEPEPPVRRLDSANHSRSRRQVTSQKMADILRRINGRWVDCAGVKRMLLVWSRGSLLIIIIIIQHLFCAIYLAIVAIQRRITNIYT